MKHEQHTRPTHGQTCDSTYTDEMLKTLPDFQHAFAWHTDLCGISEKVLQEYVAETRQAAQQGRDPHTSRHA